MASINFKARATGVSDYTVTLTPLEGGATVSGTGPAVETGSGTKQYATPFLTLTAGFYNVEIFQASTTLKGESTIQVTGDGTGDYWARNHLKNSQTILDRIGAFAGSGVNSILGFLRAIMRKDVTKPSDVGGTYDTAADSQEALSEGVLRPTTAGRTLAVNEDGSVDADASLSDASIDRLSGTIARFIPPAWTGIGWDRPVVIGDSYLGDLALRVTIQNWQGNQSLASAASIAFTGKRTVDNEEQAFSFSVEPGGIDSADGTDVIYIALTAAQTATVNAGTYKCDITANWTTNSESVSLFPSGFKAVFRERNS